MSKSRFHIWHKDWGHASQEDLLQLLDGSLPAGAVRRIQAHLESCWNCRTEYARLSATITSFVELRRTLLGPYANPPDSSARFEEKLRQVALTAPPRRPWKEQWRWAAAAAVLVVAGATVWMRLQSTPTVSAAEILRSVDAAEKRALQHVQDPVIHQKLVVRRRRVGGPASDTPLETWHGPAYEKRHGDAAPLLEILKANQLDGARLLSGQLYRQYRARVAHESVRKTEDGQGTPIWLLESRSDAASRPNGIRLASLAVRASDSHPLEEKLAVDRGAWQEEFSIREVSFAVVARKDLPPATQTELRQSPAAASIRVTPLPVPAAAPISATLPSFDFDEAQVDIHYALHRVQACRGEAITVRRSPDRITVDGILDDEARRRQVAAALSPFAGLPQIRIRLRTPAEEPMPPASQQVHFGSNIFRRAVPIQEQLAQPAEWMRESLNLADSLLAEAWALQRLNAAFPSSRVRSLQPHSSWLVEVMWNDHQRAVKAQTSLLTAKMGQVPGWQPGPHTLEPARSIDDGLNLLLERARHVNAELSKLVAAKSVTSAQTESALAGLGLALPRIESCLSDLGRLAAQQFHAPAQPHVP